MDIPVYVEISKDTKVKYEYDFDLKALICDRVLTGSYVYPANYGFIPNTLSGDGDPIDAVIYMEQSIISGSYIKCRIIGALETHDEKGEDTKLILCPMPKVSHMERHVNDIEDIPKAWIDDLTHFYQHYKTLEKKKVTIGNLVNKADAIKKYHASIEKYNAEK